MSRPTRRALLAGAAAVGTASAAADALAQTARAATATTGAPLLIVAPFARSRAPLDGPWAYIVDPNDSAGRKPRDRRSFWLAQTQERGAPLLEYDWGESPVMLIPGDWNSRDRALEWYDGPAYFRRTFQTAPAPGRRSFLHFEAVNYRATVWLNGEEVGRHEGGFTPFFVEVTAKLKPGENAVTVRADSRPGPETLPSVDFDWKNFGGITRSVWLLDLPATFVRDSFVRLEGDRIVADVTLDGPAAAGAPVSVALPDLRLTLTGSTGADGRATFSVKAPRGLKLWSPERPTLYAVRVSGAGDAYEDRIGFRTVATRGREILLNGRPRFLRGISLHEEPIGHVGTRVVSETDARALLTEAKALGCDFVRLAHYPHSEHTARLCDELGLLAWAEIPVYWEDVAYDSARTLGLARSMTAEMVLRDRNRASVIFWSVANETPITEPRTAFLRTLIGDVRRLDSTRLVTAALNKNVDVGGAREGESRLVVKDPLGADLDVIAINQYEGWYGSRTPDQIRKVSFASDFDKPLIMSEFGADALYGWRGDRRDRWTEEYQAWIYEETLPVLDRDGFAGVAPWLLKDFRSPRRWHGKFQQFWNRKGVISEDGRRKLAFDVLRRYYEGKAAGR